MKTSLSRRRFMTVTAMGSLAGSAFQSKAQSPQILTRKLGKPVVIASPNGNRSKDDEGMTCITRAYKMITQEEDILDAVVAGVNILEQDPEDSSVGYGGLPNANGVVQLDASVMHGPLKRAGAVASLEGVRTPASVARLVMHQTDHHLLVGPGAQEFARIIGFKIEADLNTDNSMRLYLEWKRRTDPSHYLDPQKRAALWHQTGLELVREGLIDPDHYYGTVNCNAVNHRGDVAGVTTTSGLAWKIPGRVGDSPILGAGLYVDGDVGAAGSTGRGEANLFSLCSFLIVESMRNGMEPLDAGMTALKRVASNTTEKRLLNEKGEPNFGLNFYIVNNKGQYAGVSLHPSRFAVCTEHGPRVSPTESLFS